MVARRSVTAVLLGLWMLALTGCADDWQEVNLFAMDTYNVISAQASDDALDGATALIMAYENLFSRTDSQSELSQLNAQGSMSVDDLSLEVVELLTTAAQIAIDTDGAFDPTMAVLSDLWDFTSTDPTLPADGQIADALTVIGYENLTIGDTITLANDIQLDLGGIAKGYVTDQIVAYFEALGVENAIISLGGNTYVMGDKDGDPYQVGIADPFDTSSLLGVLSLTDQAVVTSGDYQRYFEIDGVVYHHILDRQTGYPADTGLASVTVVCDSATIADAYATALYVMGLDAGLAMVEATEELEAIFVTADGDITCSSGLVGVFEAKG